ncbi:dienelactone hydrolase family protein [Phycicoccus sonneratiae]|uniref:Dienelactone hydrolase family protein n=1 Tax=Phycicoccus sonneratiae TaxID=2807628 RepID=A0ABS2CMV1_9MICO|nr:dienelactone hydrolase family protein [Phycicoccus sonneraticus]MBM6401153.1 dienelactone hydrolase family protein [Phycicoccus sonneraticus]
MTDILLLHHLHGLTAGVTGLADGLRAGGHTVHTPDLFEGRTFATLDEGADFARSVGFDVVRARGVAAAEGLPDDLVVAGISLGVMAAQQLAQNRPGVRAALLYEAFAAPENFGTWPDGVPAQVHGMEHDPFFGEEGDLDAAREFAAGRDDVEVFAYPGSVHLFTDSTLPTYDADATRLVLDRSLELLGRLG